jgi:hypothetical protein
MKTENKFEKLILQIIRQTTEGNIDWEKLNPPRAISVGTEDIVEDYFETEYKDQTIAVFERRYREYDPEHDVMFWTSRDCFAFISGSNSPVRDNRIVSWETSDHPSALSSLIKVAKESAADVDGIVDKLLN